MNKSVLRELYKEKRKGFSEDEIRLRSLDLLRQLKQTTIFEKQVFHVFLPIKRQKEIFTWFLIEFLRMKNKTIVISQSNFETSSLEHFIFEKNTVLKENKYGILEPIQARKINPKELDVVFVPLLISDINKYRVGYGKGFYDRFLIECKKEVVTIGLNFFEPIPIIKDLNLYDIPLKNIFYNKV